jgi:orotate phosphoribosyltransferase
MNRQEEIVGLLDAREGHFLLESGHHGDLWLELDFLFLRPARLAPLAAELARRLAAHEVDAVCGPLTGGGFLAQLVAAELDVESYYSERSDEQRSDGLYAAEYRLPAGLRESVRGKRVAIVDDVVNAASATRATLRDLEACGARTVALGALLTLGAAASRLAEDAGLALERLASLPSSLWEPSECPMCAAGVTLERTP